VVGIEGVIVVTAVLPIPNGERAGILYRQLDGILGSEDVGTGELLTNGVPD
jgi:hypothetical protein